MMTNLPVVVMLLGTAAALQCVLPAFPFHPLKVPLLAAVAFYYALERPLLPAVVVALWAGILNFPALPELPEPLSMLLTVVPMQMLAWCLAVERGTHPDTFRRDDPEYARAFAMMQR